VFGGEDDVLQAQIRITCLSMFGCNGPKHIGHTPLVQFDYWTAILHSFGNASHRTPCLCLSQNRLVAGIVNGLDGAVGDFFDLRP
jgi:hypothetical protein